MSSSSSPKCCCNFYWSNPRQNISFWCKPCRVLVSTFANWWIPRICLFFCSIFYIVVTFGFKIGIHLSVYDLNENISAREIMWHMVSMCWSFFAAFYAVEWCKDGKRTSEDTIYDLQSMSAVPSEKDIEDNDIFSGRVDMNTKRKSEEYEHSFDK